MMRYPTRYCCDVPSSEVLREHVQNDLPRELGSDEGQRRHAHPVVLRAQVFDELVVNPDPPAIQFPPGEFTREDAARLFGDGGGRVMRGIKSIRFSDFVCVGKKDRPEPCGNWPHDDHRAG
jgi:hypothetical protein